MTRNDTSARRDDGRTRRDLHEEVTQTIIDALERGVVPWRSPILGRGKAGHPTNLESDRPYAGVNVFLLALAGWSAGYGSRHWLTFKQALARGGSVRKGERSTLVVFWKLYETKDRETGDSATVPVLKHYHVFNAEQCDGIITPDTADLAPTEFRPIDAAQAIANGYVGGPSVTHTGSRAFYRPSTDAVVLPEATRFTSGEEYYSTLFHELAHSTGHSSRLDRKLDTDLSPFGSADYAKEELVAEMASAFLSAEAGIRPAVIENQAAYVAGWLKSLRDDKRLVVTAAGAAQRAADWIRGERRNAERSAPTVAAA